MAKRRIALKPPTKPAALWAGQMLAPAEIAELRRDFQRSTAEALEAFRKNPILDSAEHVDDPSPAIASLRPKRKGR